MESYEKKYKDALGWMQSVYPTMTGADKEDAEHFFPELKESEDERIRKGIIRNLQYLADRAEGFVKDELAERIAWLEKQGEQETDEWKEGNIIRHGGILALVIRGRRVMKSNGEIFTVQYPDEWVKAAPKEIEHFLNEFEKQSEQPQGKTALEAAKEEKVDNQNCAKPADKVEPKFHKGDWIISNDKKSIYQVIEVKRGIYVIRDNADNHEYHIGIEECEKSGRLFTIHYAKNGDVLASGQDIFIFKEIRGAWIYCYCLGDNDGSFMANSYDLMRYNYYDVIHPATKEQRDTLMKAMVDAGYTFDFDKKILNKIEQKPAWSEEDEAHIDSLLKRLEGINKPGAAFISTRFSISEDKDWLKSLKDRVGCEANCTTTWKPSKEQMEAIRLARSFVVDDFSEKPTLSDILVELEKQLKKL